MVPVVTRSWAAEDTEAKPQNLRGKLGVLTFPIGSSYKGVNYPRAREMKVFTAMEKTLENRVENFVYVLYSSYCIV